MRAAPATIGGMPRSSKRASERQSATSSRSPCTTWIAIAVWPSLKVVNSCAWRDGNRGVARDDLLDQAAHGLDARATAGSRRAAASRRPARWLPASTLAWIAAPSATTLSGSRLLSGVAAEELADRALDLRHARRAADHHHALDVRRPSAARRAAPCARARASSATRCCVMRQKVSVSACTSTTSPERRAGAVMRASAWPVRYSFASRALTSSRRVSLGATAARASPASTIQQNTRWSKSSPPSAESPPVASTSNTPRESRGSRCRTCRRPGRRPRRCLRRRCRGRRRSPPRSARSAGAARSARRACAASLVAWRCASSK